LNWKYITKIVTVGVIPALILGILIYDVIAILYGGGSEASISSFIISKSYEMPFAVYMIGFFNGILVGHLFWRMRTNEDTLKIDGLKD
jgi:hypothetical protein